MKQKQFEAQHAQLWNEITALLADPKHAAAVELPVLYRRLCQSLALALQRGYSPALTDHLQKLVLDCHSRLYGAAVERPSTLRLWLLQTLPCRVREEWRLLLLVSLCFWGVAAGLGLLVWLQPHWAYSFISGEQLGQMRSMYQPGAAAIGRGGDQGDIMMFGYYIWNNISIDFRTFASGIFGGVPALISVLFNGMHLGVIASWLSQDPVTRPVFWSFVITHASVEITGLLLAGMAGIRLGLSVLAPGRLSRRHALMQAAERMFPVLAGATLLTLAAAFIEAFWSASAAVPDAAKYAVGGACWLAVIAFFAFAGRVRR